MGKLEIRNLESSKSHFIEDIGAVLGREGGDAEITIADQGVSKKHARIYFKRGTWFLEDLDSANGTYLEDERIAAPMVLAAGAVFTMSRQQFEVVQIYADGEEPVPHEGGGDEGDRAETNALEAGDLPDRLRSAKLKRVNTGAELRHGSKSASSSPQEVENEESPDEVAGTRTRTSKPSGSVVSAERNGSEDANAPAPSLSAFGAALPRALVHYAKAIPLMAVNPMGSIRKGIAEQPLPALSNVELVAFALPPLLFTGLVGAVCQSIAAAVSHTFTVALLFPVIPLVSAIVGSVAAGLLCHPALGWLVERVDGQSDARSRTNLFAMAMSASSVLALPGAAAALLSLSSVRPLAILPPVLMLVAALVVSFLWFSWFRYFGVAQWSEYAVLGLGALGVIAAAYTLVITSAHAFSNGPEAVAVTTPSEAEAAEAHAPPSQSPAQPAPTPVAATPPGPPAQTQAAAPSPPPTPTPSEPRPSSRGPQPSYSEYRTMRLAVEKALEEDPGLLRDRKQVLNLYRDLLVNTKAAESRFRPPEKNPSASQINTYLRNLEVYSATWKNVVDLHAALKL